MSDNIRPGLYGAIYEAHLVNRNSSAPKTPSRLVGKHCETGDILIRLGCGVVGGSVVRELATSGADLAARAGAKLELSKVAVRNLSKRDGVSDSILTTDSNSVVTDPEISLVIEVMGGIEPARELILKAIANGKSVVTAN
ncbi:MAG: hypothetical protein EBY00_05660, partial [Actinobacteria bacterium]|nr:hypothetical protein [Actinomycetota bacterium]